MKIKTKNDRRVRIQLRQRKRIAGSKERPRLSVFRSVAHIYAQVIDDLSGQTLVSASTVEPSVKGTFGKGVSGGNIKGAINIPLSEQAALRITAYAEEFPGFIDAVQPGDGDLPADQQVRQQGRDRGPVGADERLQLLGGDHAVVEDLAQVAVARRPHDLRVGALGH